MNGFQGSALAGPAPASAPNPSAPAANAVAAIFFSFIVTSYASRLHLPNVVVQIWQRIDVRF
jgi:hypothetical protein